MKREKKHEPRRVHVGQHTDQAYGHQRPNEEFDRNEDQDMQDEGAGEESGDYLQQEGRDQEGQGSQQQYRNDRRQDEAYDEDDEATDETEETDELDENDDSAEEDTGDESKGWMGQVGDLLTGQASDEAYEKATKVAALAVIGLFGLRRGGLLGGIIVAAAAGLAARTLGVDMDMAEDEATDEEDMQGEAA